MKLFKLLLCATAFALSFAHADAALAKSAASSYLKISGSYIFEADAYSPAFGVVVDKNVVGVMQQDVINYAAFKGYGAVGAIGYNLSESFFLEGEVGAEWRTDTTIAEKDALVQTSAGDNRFLTAMLNVGYALPVGKVMPFVQFGAGVANRKATYFYPGCASICQTGFNATCPNCDLNNLSTDTTKVYPEDMSASFFAYQMKLGLGINIDEAGNKIYVGYRYLGSKAINVSRDEVGEVAVDIPTDAGKLTAGNVKLPFSSLDKYYTTNWKYMSQSVEFGVMMNF